MTPLIRFSRSDLLSLAPKITESKVIKETQAYKLCESNDTLSIIYKSSCMGFSEIPFRIYFDLSDKQRFKYIKQFNDPLPTDKEGLLRLDYDEFWFVANYKKIDNFLISEYSLANPMPITLNLRT